MKKENKTSEEKQQEEHVEIKILPFITVKLGLINYKHIIVIVVILAFVWAMIKS
jgi:hypothetical protein